MGPRRTTLTYSSEDAAPVVEEKVYVYYCKYSGKHALTTDCNLSQAPRRRTDHALVIDTQQHTVKLYTTDGGSKFIKRRWERWPAGAPGPGTAGVMRWRRGCGSEIRRSRSSPPAGTQPWKATATPVATPL